MNLAVQVVRTKIIIPRRKTEILSRPRLLSILDNVLDLKLLILAAPAGYGKTSLLIDYAYHTQLPVCWFSIDALDVDPQRFIAHFISAIRNCFPSFGEASLSALSNLNQDSLNLEPVISIIINEAYDQISEHFVFVLDDYHLVRDCKPIDEFINRITLEMSENCHLVIASRTLLTLPDLTLLVARSQVEGLSYEELAFLPEEIKQLYSVNYHQNISEEAASELVMQTEGWITGLLLSAQLSPKETSNRLRLARVSGIGLYEYLAQQVLEQQSEELILFLKRTSLLEEFDAELCGRIFAKVEGIKKQNWQDMVDLLLRENLFVLPVDDETLHLRYHHLFRDFLQNLMRSERPEETAQIESHLADYYEECNEWEQAFAIAQRSGDLDKIIRIILRAAPSMIIGGRLTALSSWLDAVPLQFRHTRPELLSIDGTIAMLKGDVKTSLGLLNLAIEGLSGTPQSVELARALIRRSYLYRHIGNYAKEKADAQEAVNICRKAPGMEKLEAEALRALGLSYFHSGEIMKALETITSSLDRYNLLGDEMDAAKVLLDLGLVHITLGQLEEADAVYHKSLAYWQSSQNSLWQANLLNNIGMVQHLSGKHEQAAQSFEKGISHARLASNPRMEGFSLNSLGDLYRDIRALSEARRAYQLARSTLKSVDDQALHVFLALSEAVLERLTGNKKEMERKIEDAFAIARSGSSKFEINICRLEQSISAVLQKEYSGTTEVLDELNKFFSTEGYHLEELRAHYYLALVNYLKSPSEATEKEFSELVKIYLSGRDRTSFISFAYESFQLLLEQKQFFDQAGSLQEFLNELRKFDESLTPLRRTIRRHSETVQFTIPKLVIKSLDKCLVRIGDHSVTLSEWKTQMVRDLFFFILLHPDGVTKEEIGEAFWPESTIETIRVRFKNAIYRLRHALGSESITFIDDSYRFNRTLDFDYDAENFVQELSMAQADASLEDQIHHFRQAINYYHGKYLPKLDYDWVLIQREQYERMFISAITKLMELLLQTGQHQLVIHYADRAIEEDSCLEDAYRFAMQAYAASGDRVAVSRYYEKCRNILIKELDIEPTPQTNTLYKSLMQ